MKIRGLMTAVFRDAKTGKVTKVAQEENHVSRWMIETHCDFNGPGEDFGHNIYITNLAYETTQLGFARRGTNNQLVTGFTEAGVTNPIGSGDQGNDPYWVQFQQRFNPPGSDRDINYIGLTSGTVSNQRISPSHCGVKLTSPCVQTTTETLDVFYRVQFPFDYNLDAGDYIPDDTMGWDKSEVELLYLFHAINSTSQWPTQDSETRWNGNIDVRQLWETRSYTASGGDLDLNFGSAEWNIFGRIRYENSATISTQLGAMVGFFGYGQGDGWMRYNNLATTVDANPIQNLFPHGPSANKPFFDSGNLPTGDGTVAFGGDTWTNPSFPKMYRVNITSTGAMGVAEYQLWERSVFGFLSNTYRNGARTQHSMYITNDHMYGNFRWRRDTDTTGALGPRNVRYGDDPARFLGIRKTQVCLANAQTESGTNFRVEDFPTFDPSDITDVSVDSTGNIYVADRDGAGGDGALYIITDPTGSPSITKVDNTTTGLTGILTSDVYGVAVGRNDRVWIVMNGGMFYSDDTGATWTQATFSFTGITDAQWSRVKQIVADPEHANDHLGLVYINSSILCCWYEFSTTTASQGPNIVGSYSAPDIEGDYTWNSNEEYSWIGYALAASNTQSKWGCSARNATNSGGFPAYFVFGTTTINQHANRDCINRSINVFETDDDGNQSLFIVHPWDGNIRYGFCKDSSTIVFQEVSEADGIQGWYSNDLLHGQQVLLPGSGVIVGSMSYSAYGIGSIASQQSVDGGALTNIQWRKYGWDGADWELDNVNSKATHGSEDAAIHGLAIQFDDDSGAQTFSTGDYYTVGCMRGIWLDGSTEFTHNSYNYYNPSFYETELEVSVIPNTQRIARARVSTGTILWQNATSGMQTGTTDRLYASSNTAGPGYDRGGRSQATVGGAIPTIPRVSVEPVTVANLRFHILEGNPYDNANAAACICGLSDTSVIGNTIEYSSPQFAIHMNGKIYPGSTNAQMQIVHSGVTQYTYPEPIDVTTIDGSTALYLTIAIRSDGSVQYWYEDYVIYTTAPGTANPALTYVMDMAVTGDANNGVDNVLMESLGTNAADYVFEIGTSGSPVTGQYRDGFQNINYSRSKFYLDGIEATMLTNDIATVLPAGTISIQYWYGEVRVSASDVGKTLTADYLTHTNY